MAILKILEFPDPRLRTRARPVEVVDDALRQLIDDMFETMYDAPGIGLAATQVNVHQRHITQRAEHHRCVRGVRFYRAIHTGDDVVKAAAIARGIDNRTQPFYVVVAR